MAVPMPNLFKRPARKPATPAKKTTSTKLTKGQQADASRYTALATKYKTPAKKTTYVNGAGLTKAQQADANRWKAQTAAFFSPAPKAGVYPAWDRYALDEEEVYWQANKMAKDAGPNLNEQRIQSIVNWVDKNLRPNPTPQSPYYHTDFRNTTSTGSDGGGGGGGGSTWYDGGGTSGGGDEEEVPITWEQFSSNVSGAPSWWKAMKPSQVNEATEYLSALNMLIPFLSPEDQKTVAANIYTQNPKYFGHLNPETLQFNPVATDVTTDMRKRFQDAARSQQALSAMSELASAVGKKDEELGPGYRYLRSILNLGNQFGSTGADMQTRRQQMNFMSALDPLLGQASTQQLAPYESLVRMLTSPYFTGGQLMPIQKNQSGQVIFGTPIKSLL